MRDLFLRKSGAAALAVVVAAWAFSARPAGQGTAVASRAVATPRTADGKPDLSGVWGGTGAANPIRPDESGNITQLSRGRPCHPGSECKPGFNFERDSGFRQRNVPNVPLYKPQFWEKVEYLDVNGNQYDLSSRCYPEGLPRIGPPSKIVQTPTEMIFLYTQDNLFRVIPIDGRKHDPIRAQDLTWYGEAVGHWEGDTLVIDVVGFTDESWIGWAGWFHSNNMRVIERLRREGDTLTWQVTVHDPDVLLQPWERNPVTVRLNPDPKAVLTESLPCDERDWKHMATRERG